MPSFANSTNYSVRFKCLKVQILSLILADCGAIVTIVQQERYFALQAHVQIVVIKIYFLRRKSVDIPSIIKKILYCNIKHLSIMSQMSIISFTFSLPSSPLFLFFFLLNREGENTDGIDGSILSALFS